MIRRFIVSLAVSFGMFLYAAEIPDSVESVYLDEVTVNGNGATERLSTVRLGAERLELSRLLRMPSMGGESDIIKSLSLLPGVRSEGEGAGGFEVRGGTAAQNLVILDGITLYNPAHVMGIFSTFNDDALGGATLYKGPIPAMYGDATSSVLETSLAPGDMEQYHASFSIGILSAKLKAEGPIVRNKMSFAVTARRSYVDMFLKMVPRYRSTVMNFYDVTAKLRYKPGRSHLIDASFFISRDNMAISRLMGMYWGNTGLSLNWQARASDNVTFTTIASMTRFSPEMEMDMMNINERMNTYIHNYSLKERIRVMISDDHVIEPGFQSELLRVKSAEWIIHNSREKEVRSLWENVAWVDYTGSFADRFHVSAGVRVEVASIMTGDKFHAFSSIYDVDNQFDGHNYFSILPRFSVKYDFNHNHNIKAGVGETAQYLHAIRSGTTSFPFDRYALTSARVKPEHALQYSVGYTGKSTSGKFDWSAEAYYRDVRNVYDFIDGRGPFSDIVLERIILGGKGRSYGLELMARKNFGRLTGWVSYTLSKTMTRIAGINDDRWYDATNDCRNDFSVSAIFKINERWSASGSWMYQSGRPLTAPDVKYEIAGETCYYYSRRNGYLTPSTHRLDISARYEHRGKKFTYLWDFGIYNTYCRYNPYVVYFEDDPSKPSGTRAVVRAMFGLVPSVSYTLKF